MRFPVRRLLVVFISLVTLLCCNRDPKIAKRRYVENGNKYFSRGKYREAAIMYRNALQKDLRYGPAHYRLGLTLMKAGDVSKAVASLRRAVELLPIDVPEHWDAAVKLSEIYLGATREKQFMNEVQEYAEAMLKRDPNSYDGHRLTAELHFVNYMAARQSSDSQGARKELAAAIQEYLKADAVKPDEPIVVVALARSYANNRQFDEAEKLYWRALGKDKTLTVAYTELYQLYIVQNKINDAEKLLKTAFENNPKRYVYLTMLAAHYYGARRPDDMKRVLQDIKAHSKQYENAYLVVGDFYLRLGDGDQAIQQYQEGMNADERRKTTYQKRIIEVLMRQGKRGSAAELNAEILKQSPKDTDARGLEASLMIDKGEIQKGIAELQAVVTSDPSNFVARYNLGRAHIAKGELEQARQDLSEAIRLRRDYLPARMDIARIQVMKQEYDSALKSVQEILQLDPQNANARLIESTALMGMKKFADSRELLQGMLKAAPNSSDIQFQMGVLNLADKRFNDARDSFQKAYQLNPASSRGLMGLVETYMMQKKPEEAIQTLDEEVKKQPNRIDLRLALANTGARSGNFDLALTHYQTILDSLQNNTRSAGDIYLRMGETYRRKGDLNASIMVLQKAREVMPENPVVVGALAMTLEAAGRVREARQAYEQTLKLDPRNGVALNNLAFLMAEGGGDLDQALTYAQRAKQLMPNLSEVSDTLGWIYLKKNLSDNAIEIFRELVTRQPAHATYRYHLGMAFSLKGDKSRALKELQEALRHNPPREEGEKIRALMAKL